MRKPTWGEVLIALLYLIVAAMWAVLIFAEKILPRG